MGRVISFPRTHDRPFVWRQARRMAELKPKAAENWLAYILRKHRETLEDRSVAPAMVEEQVAALEVAIRYDLALMTDNIGGVA